MRWLRQRASRRDVLRGVGAGVAGIVAGSQAEPVTPVVHTLVTPEMVIASAVTAATGELFPPGYVDQLAEEIIVEQLLSSPKLRECLMREAAAKAGLA